MFNLIGIDALDRVNRAARGWGRSEGGREGGWVERHGPVPRHKHRSIFRLRNALSSIRTPILRGTACRRRTFRSLFTRARRRAIVSPLDTERMDFHPRRWETC